MGIGRRSKILARQAMAAEAEEAKPVAKKTAKKTAKKKAPKKDQ